MLDKSNRICNKKVCEQSDESDSNTDSPRDIMDQGKIGSKLSIAGKHKQISDQKHIDSSLPEKVMRIDETSEMRTRGYRTESSSVTAITSPDSQMSVASICTPQHTENISPHSMTTLFIPDVPLVPGTFLPPNPYILNPGLIGLAAMSPRASQVQTTRHNGISSQKVGCSSGSFDGPAIATPRPYSQSESTSQHNSQTSINLVGLRPTFPAFAPFPQLNVHPPAATPGIVNGMFPPATLIAPYPVLIPFPVPLPIPVPVPFKSDKSIEEFLADYKSVSTNSHSADADADTKKKHYASTELICPLKEPGGVKMERGKGSASSAKCLRHADGIICACCQTEILKNNLCGKSEVNIKVQATEHCTAKCQDINLLPDTQEGVIDLSTSVKSEQRFHEEELKQLNNVLPGVKLNQTDGKETFSAVCNVTSGIHSLPPPRDYAYSSRRTLILDAPAAPREKSHNASLDRSYYGNSNRDFAFSKRRCVHTRIKSK